MKHSIATQATCAIAAPCSKPAPARSSPRALRLRWSTCIGLPDKATVFGYSRKQPIAKEEATQKVGTSPALVTSARRVKASDEFAVQTHASLGPSCAVADFSQGQLDVWSASQATCTTRQGGHDQHPRRSVRGRRRADRHHDSGSHHQCDLRRHRGRVFSRCRSRLNKSWPHKGRQSRGGG